MNRKRTGRCIFRRHDDLSSENVAIPVHLFLLVFLDDLENPSFAHRFYPLARFSSEFHEFREPEPEPLEKREREMGSPSSSLLPRGISLREANIFFCNLVEDRGGEHLLVTVLHTVPLLLDPSAPVATSETGQSLRLLDDTLHDVAKRLRRASHIRARFV